MEKSRGREPVRINKYLSDAGFCSRREADRLVEAGKVYVDGQLCVMGQKVLPDPRVVIEGKEVNLTSRLVLILLNKPVGIECTTAKDNPDNIVDFVGYPERIYPIGRLDKNSSGLILLTNTGELSDGILKARNFHEKEYIVEVDRPLTGEAIKKFSQGVDIGDAVTRPCVIEKINGTCARVVLTQGLNRQIRRMFDALGYNVTSLKRVRIMNIELGSLPYGKWREASEQEIKGLIGLLNKNKNEV